MVIALARLAGAALRARQAPVLRVFLVAEIALLFAFFALAVSFGPWLCKNASGEALTPGVPGAPSHAGCLRNI
ncbi:MAG TPA: hypothetical protein VF501_03025 [Thiobacillus sp.]